MYKRELSFISAWSGGKIAKVRCCVCIDWLDMEKGQQEIITAEWTEGLVKMKIHGKE